MDIFNILTVTYCFVRLIKLPHSVPKGPKSGKFKTREGLVQGKKY
jgi:hypothetical protein